MSKVVKLAQTDLTNRADYAARLRQVADDIEAETDTNPIAMAVVILSEAPWEKQHRHLVDWSTPWPRGVFAEAVKYELLRDIEKRGEIE